MGCIRYHLDGYPTAIVGRTTIAKAGRQESSFRVVWEPWRSDGHRVRDGEGVEVAV